MKTKKVMKKSWNTLKAFSMPLLIGGAILLGAVLMFGGFMSLYAIGVLTNLMLTLSLAYVAYAATKYVCKTLGRTFFSQPYTPSEDNHHITSNLLGLGMAAAVLITGIALTATAVWTPLALPFALSLAVTILAGFSLGLLAKASVDTVKHIFYPDSYVTSKIAKKTVKAKQFDEDYNLESDPSIGAAYSYNAPLTKQVTMTTASTTPSDAASLHASQYNHV